MKLCTTLLAAPCLAGLILFAGAAAALADEHAMTLETLDEQTQSLLDAMIKQFADARALQVAAYQAMQMPGFPGDMTSTVAFSAMRPNLYRLETESAMAGGTIVSDGTTQYVYYPMFDQYTQSPAPLTMREFGSDPMATAGADAGVMMFLVPILVPELIHEHASMVKSIRFVGEETLDDVETRRYHLRFGVDLDAEDEPELPAEIAMLAEGISEVLLDIWIRPEPAPLPVRIDWDLTEMMREMMQDMAEQMPGMDAFPGDESFVMRIQFDNWQLNPVLSENHFAFHPPDSATEAESFMAMLGGGMPGNEASELLGRAAPDFELELLDGGTFTLSDHQGRDIVVLDFWATWCGPCVQAMPTMIKVTDQFADRNVAFYAVNQMEQQERVKEFIAEREWKLNVPMDVRGEAARKYNVSGIPQTVIIHTDGTVQAVHVGFLPDLEVRLARELETLLAGELLVEAPESDENAASEADDVLPE